MNLISFRAIGAPATGQTPLFCDQMAPGFDQHIYDKSIECYCLDAPEYLPSGSPRAIGCGMAIDQFVCRG